jgi:hypothetical protein
LLEFFENEALNVRRAYLPYPILAEARNQMLVE